MVGGGVRHLAEEDVRDEGGAALGKGGREGAAASWLL